MYPAYHSPHTSTQGSSLQKKKKLRTKRPPPHIPNPSIGAEVGVPLHVCANGAPSCVKCRLGAGQGGVVWTSDGRTPLAHRRFNVCAASEPRVTNPPRELAGRLAPFDFTVQLSDLPGDPAAWLFCGDTLIALIAPLANHTALITKPTNDPRYSNTLAMTRENVAGPGYVVCVSFSCFSLCLCQC